MEKDKKKKIKNKYISKDFLDAARFIVTREKGGKIYIEQKKEERLSMVGYMHDLVLVLQNTIILIVWDLEKFAY